MLQESTIKTRLFLKTLVWLFLGIILLVTASIGWSWCQKFWFVPIRLVTIANKLQYTDPELIKVAVKDELKRGFFSLKVATMRDNLLQVPWVAAVQVHRKWPQTVVVKITERQPLAVWESRGIIDTEGKLFFPERINNVQNVPEFIGDKTQVSAMVDTYLLILAKIKPVGLAVKRLEIMRDGGWRAMLDNGVDIVLGKIELEERLTRFVLAYSQAGSVICNDKVQNVDLRYTNGLAVMPRQ